MKKSDKKPKPPSEPPLRQGQTGPKGKARQAKAAKAKAKEAKKAAAKLAAAQAKADKAFDVEKPGRTWTDPETGITENLPPLVDLVHDLRLRGFKRRWILGHALPRYGCSAMTVDRAIAAVKAEIEEITRTSRAERVADAAAKLDYVYNQSIEAGDRRNARAAVKDRQHVLGDLKPDTVIGIIDAGSFEELKKQAKEQDELLARAEREHREGAKASKAAE